MLIVHLKQTTYFSLNKFENLEVLLEWLKMINLQLSILFKLHLII